MEKLELKHLAPYLPYSLRIKTKYGWDTMSTLNEWEVNGDHEDSYSYEDHPDEILEFKPILRPLSDLQDSENDIREMIEEYACSDLTWIFVNDLGEIRQSTFELLIQHHFDVFGLIEKGLAIDINTIKN